MRSFKEKRGRYCVRVISVSMSTAKAMRILCKISSGAFGRYDGDRRDAYLDGVRFVHAEDSTTSAKGGAE